MAVFLISYNMYKRDYIAGRLAGTFAVCVAILPTMPSMNPSKSAEVIGKLHLPCAHGAFAICAEENISQPVAPAVMAGIYRRRGVRHLLAD
jgi:hypothetical protein